MTSRDYFKDKRIAVVGLGPHGEMVEDVKFLIKAGAIVAIYDLRSEARLKSHLVYLRSIGLANYVCGSIPAEDLLDMDLIILSSEYSRDSQFLKIVEDKKIPIEYAETLFFKLAPPVTVVGVMGGCGKATVMSMLSPMLEFATKKHDGQGFFTIDPESDEGILAHLKKIKSGDIVLVRIIESMMKELYDIRSSPHVAIFTTLPPPTSYNQIPFEILSYQTYNNFIIASDEIIDATHKLKFQPKAKMLRTKSSLVPLDWEVQGRGLHDRDNASLALQAARLFKVGDNDAQSLLEKWKALRGRIEPVKKVKNIEFYNDTASVSAGSTKVALTCLAQNKNVVLIFGGMDTGVDGNMDYKGLYTQIPECAHSVILVPGSGTLRQRNILKDMDGATVHSAPSIEEAVRMSLEHARKGDKVLFSPGFGAGGLDRSRAERGERFVRAVRSL